MIQSEPYHLYALLGVANTATPQQIKDGYKSQVKLKHPDIGGNPDDFVAVVNAFTILSDPKTRKEYDDNGGHLHSEIVDGMQNVRGDALSRMAASFKGLVEKTDIVTLDKSDIIKHMQSTYANAIVAAEMEQKSLHEHIRSCDRLIKRIKRNKVGENPFIHILDEMKAKDVQDLTRLGYDIRVFKRVLDELALFESPVDIMSGFGYSGGYAYGPDTPAFDSNYMIVIHPSNTTGR